MEKGGAAMLRRPSIRQLFIWQLWTVLFSLLPSLLTSLLLAPGSKAWRLATFAWMGGALAQLLLYFPAKYLRLGYALDQQRLLLCSGVLYLHTAALPLAAVQTVRITAGPLQRLLGLRTVRAYAAGARLSVPGLPREEAAQLACQLLPEGVPWL